MIYHSIPISAPLMAKTKQLMSILWLYEKDWCLADY
jgi:hypothetical protein